MSLTFCVADIHGRLDLFEKAYDLVRGDGSASDKLVVMGDFVDRGPESAQLIARLRELQVATTGPELVVLRGNHEDIMSKAYHKPGRNLNWWCRNGGFQTLLSYGMKPDGSDWDDTLPLMADDVAWADALPDVYEDEHRIFVHAGIPWGVEVADTPVHTRQWMLYGHMANEVEWTEPEGQHVSGKHIVHGHHQSEDHPLLLAGRTNLDGGAYYTGRLHIGAFDAAIPGGPSYVVYVDDRS